MNNNLLETSYHEMQYYLTTMNKTKVIWQKVE